MSFGVTLIVAVVAVLFAAGTWVIRSGQTLRAREHSAKVSEELGTARQSLDRIQREKVEVEAESTSQQQRIADLQSSESKLKDSITRLEAELESAQRELGGTKDALAETRKKEVDPTALPLTKLVDILRGGPVRIRVTVEDDGKRAGLSEGAIIEKTKQQCETTCGIHFNDSSTTFVIVRILAVTGGDNRTAVAAIMRIDQPWKVPGASNMQWVSVWQQQTLGVTAAANAPPFTENLIGDLVNALAKALQK